MSSSAKRAVWSVVQIIAGVALMMQSYLVTEDDNKRLNSDQKVFKWLVAVLACAIKGKRWRGYGFAVIEVIEVSDVLTFILIIIIRGKSGPISDCTKSILALDSGTFCDARRHDLRHF